MSSTKRSNARDAERKLSADYYVTPVSAIKLFFDAFESDWKDLLDTSAFSFDKPLCVLDPCAGGDDKHEMSYPTAITSHRLWNILALTTIDIREDSRADAVGNYLALILDDPDVIITNPPFNLALAIIQKALSDVRMGGLVIMLLRLNFFGSLSRRDWFQKNMPLACYVHARRMGFADHGATDSIEYCHFIWQKQNYPRFTSLRII